MTIYEKYGVKNIAHIENVQDKKKITNLKKYGYDFNRGGK